MALGAAVLVAALTGCATPAGTARPGGAPATGSNGPATAQAASAPKAAGHDSGAATKSAVPKKNQAFMLQAQDRGTEEPVLTVTASGRIGTYPGGADVGEREQFGLVPRTPGATSYLLKTARLCTG